MPDMQQNTGAPSESYIRVSLRFLRFGLLAWGGPVAQIAMLQQELVEDERWIPPERFNRVLSVYQILPGPEAHELCVYFGMLAGDRMGGFLAGLGFMLPGFLLMFTLSWFYIQYGLGSPLFSAIFIGFQVAVVALIVRAVHRIGGHALTDRPLWMIAIVAGLLELAGAHFLVTLAFAGVAYVLTKRGRYIYIVVVIIAALLLAGTVLYASWFADQIMTPVLPPHESAAALATPTLLSLFGSGLRSGLLTFGGAYTVIPFLQHDAVEVGKWMSNTQFLDGLALSGILPAPLIIFSPFVGYLGGGPSGAIALTIGIFLPAFAITLIGHTYLEKAIANKSLHNFLDGVTAGVVGLITITAFQLLRTAITGIPAFVIFVLSLLVLYLWKAKTAVVFAILGAGIIGMLVKYVL
jgi:chromate transporter